MSPTNGSRQPRFLETLSTPPSRAWPDAVVHHGVRVLLLVLVASAVTAFFPPQVRMRVTRYEPGQVAQEDVIAQIGFDVPKTPEELERDRGEAAATMPPTFDFRPEASDSMASSLEGFFGLLDAAAEDGGEDAVERVLNSYDISANPGQVTLLTDPEARRMVERAALRGAREILVQGVVDPTQAQAITTGRITVREGEEERRVAREEVLTQREFYDRSVELLPARAPPDASDVLRLILVRFSEYSYSLNVVATELDRNAARQAVPVTKGSVLAGEAIVRANSRIDQETLEKLQAYESALRNAGMLEEIGVDVRPFLGSTLLNLLVLAVFGLLIFFFRGEIYVNFRWVLLLGGLTTAYFGAAAIVSRNVWPAELLPIAFVTLAVAILWDGRMALVLALVLSILTGAQPPFSDYEVLAMTAAGGAGAALSVRALRRRSQVWVFIALISAAYALTILALWMIRGDLEASEMATKVVWAAGNATLSSILAMGFIPVFEWITGITTDQTLLEWADPNRELLKRLSMEAPGTYAHTINVANLAEAGASAVGANGLLCRVGLYYHDVGKMLRPQYFVENQPDGRNPHDKLKPDTSASIVREHVIEGLRLAREAKVPEVIAAFIPEHHGTQRISFFYEKAKEELGEEAVDVEQFSYPGPKPQSKETAIAMLSDSVESATRVLQDPTPERVRDLIEKVVEGKIQQGQLDETPLTLHEIALLKEQFVKVLSGMYHHRVEYPETRHLTTGEDGGKVEDGEDVRVPDGVTPPEPDEAPPEEELDPEAAAPGKAADATLPDPPRK